MTTTQQQTHDLLDRLSPVNRDVVALLIKELAEKDGIKVDLNASYLVNLRDAFDLWTSDLELQGFAKETIKSYRANADRLLAVYHMPTELDIKSYLSKRLKSGVTKGTIAAYIKAFRSFFNYLYANNMIASNPTTHLKQPAEGKYQTRRVPTEDDIREFFTQDMSLEDRSSQMLFVETGLRVSELASIELDNIDFRTQRITVIGKGGKQRNVFVSSQATLIALLEYAQTLPQDVRYLYPAKTTHSVIIPDRHIHRRTLAARLDKLCKQAGITHLSPHQLRHFAATYLISHGADIKAVSELLGHAGIEVTLKIYHHVTEKSIRTMHERYSPFVLKAGEIPLLTTQTVNGEVVEVED